MKKLALTSLLAFMAVSGAHAANVIDGNPLYMPRAGHFYSVTTLGSHTHVNSSDVVTLAEDFGYGITDKLAVEVGTSLMENDGFDDYAWQDLSLKATFRAIEKDGFVGDVYGGFEMGPNHPIYNALMGIPGGGLYYHNKLGDANGKTNFWFDKDLTGYSWTAGVRGGYMSSLFTIAGHAEYTYANSEMFNWGDKGLHALSFGLDGQFVIDSNWNLVGGVEYTGITNDHLAYDDMEAPWDNENAGIWEGYFGVNYNIDATKYVGVAVNGSLNHQGGDNGDEWDFDKGFGFGVRFGVDF